MPVFGVVGDGKYPLHPVHVSDMARLCIEAGLDEHGEGEYDMDAVNPEKTDFVDLLQTIKKAIGSRCFLLKHLHPELAYQMTKPFNMVFEDILIDRTDIDLMTKHITKSDKEPLGRIAFSDWVNKHGD